MKKVLAIVLSVIMALSVCGIAASAAVEAPEFPTPVSGRIYFAADYTYVVAGGTYEVPVYLVSDFDTTITNPDAFVELGFTCKLAGFNNPDPESSGTYGKITGIEFADAIQSIDGFKGLDCLYTATAEDCDEFHGNLDNGYVAFAAGLSTLKQEKIQVATVTVKIADDFPGGDAAPYIVFNEYDFNFLPYGNYFDGYGGIFTAPMSEDALEWGDAVDPDVLLEKSVDGEGNLFFSFGYLFEEPPVPSWKDRLLDWLKKTINQFLDTFDEINGLIRGLLEQI